MPIDYSRLRDLAARQLTRALLRDGFSLSRKLGSHQRYRHSDGRRVTVSFHRSSASFPPKTLKKIIEAPTHKKQVSGSRTQKTTPRGSRSLRDLDLVLTLLPPKITLFSQSGQTRQTGGKSVCLKCLANKKESKEFPCSLLLLWRVPHALLMSLRSPPAASSAA